MKNHKSLFPVEITLNLVHFGDREINCAIARDISERTRLEVKLQESERTYRNLVETSNDLIFKCDEAGRFTYLNPMWEVTHGYRLDEMLGHVFTEFVSPDRSEIDFAEFSRHLEGGSVSGFEDIHVSKTGEQIHLVFDVVPLRDGDENIIGTQGTAHDITARKRAEDERLSLERQILQAQKLESLGVLAGGIAHDFNNILMTVLGNADLALQDLAPHAPARDNIGAIEKASREAAALARQMLAYSGKGKFAVESIDLNEFIHEMAHLLEVSISKSVVMKYNFDSDLPSIDGDPSQIRQVIMNLIINASEAIGNRSGAISLSTGHMECDRKYLDTSDVAAQAGLDESPDEGLYAFIEVSDTGCGMNSETRQKIFDPFFTTKFTGRGLGMAAILGIVRGHRGAIMIYSEVGRGTSIKVLFPAGEQTEMPESGGAKAEEEAPWRGEGTILLVDDEEFVVDVGAKLLERMGFSVITAADGVECIEKFREHANDIVCVLLDLTMPHMDGKEAFMELRRIKEDVRVILCSGYNEQDTTQEFSGKGLAGFLQKPYHSEDLRAKLMETLSA